MILATVGTAHRILPLTPRVVCANQDRYCKKARTQFMNSIHATEHDTIWRFGHYFIGRQTHGLLSGWPRHVISEDLHLISHPQLDVIQEPGSDCNVTLIGYLIDPLHPAYDNRSALKELIQEKEFLINPFTATDRFGGRWVLIIQGQGDIRLFSDPAGLRQVFYTLPSAHERIECACEPGLLADISGCGLDDHALAFHNSLENYQNSEYWWPGNATPFSNVKKLLPNHYLSLRTGEAVRFWPYHDYTPRSKDSVLELMAERLPALMSAIASRGKTAVAITAGWDSRMILAACRTILSQLEFMTIQQIGMQQDHADMVIPKLLSQQLNFKYDAIKSGTKQDVRESFRQVYKDSIFYYHEKWLPDAQIIFDKFQQSTITVVGSMAETGRLFYDWAFRNNTAISSEMLAAATGLGNHPFVLKEFDRWLQGTDDLKGYPIADIFYWEQRAGRWLATSQLEFGLVWKDIFSPFNNRELLTAMLSVDQSIRKPPDYRFFRMLIEKMWSKTLSEPINPHQTVKTQSPVRRLKIKLKHALKRWGG
jgi:hypothetical protein